MAGCDEQSLVVLPKQLGQILKPRNEMGAARGVINIRYVLGFVGRLQVRR